LWIPRGNITKTQKIEEKKRKEQAEREAFQKSLAESAAETNPEEFMERLREFGDIMFPGMSGDREAKAAKPKHSYKSMGYPQPDEEIEEDPATTASKSAPPIKTLADLGLKLVPKPAPEPIAEEPKPEVVQEATKEEKREDKPKSAEDNHIWSSTEVQETKADLASASTAASKAQVSADATPAAAEPATPEHKLEKVEGGVRVIVQLPLLEGMGGVELNVQPKCLELSAPPHYQMHVDFDCAVDEDECRAKFNRKKRQLTITIPSL